MFVDTPPWAKRILLPELMKVFKFEIVAESTVSVAPLTSKTSILSITKLSLERSTFLTVWCCLNWLDRFSVFTSSESDKFAIPIVFLLVLTNVFILVVIKYSRIFNYNQNKNVS